MTHLYDGLTSDALARSVGVPRVVVFDETTSTMDDAHALAAGGAPSGTLVLAEFQSRGRGRSGGVWRAVKGSSILCTMIERPDDASALDVLSLRIGLNVAAALDVYAAAPVRLKWPNDVIIDDHKVAGILVEARWRNSVLEWVALAIGLNVGAAPAAVDRATSLTANASRLDVLSSIIPAMRRAAAERGKLRPAEMDEWIQRDWLSGRRIAAPVRGIVAGILATGELVVETESGSEVVRAGTVLLEER